MTLELRLDATAVELPPVLELPQVTTEPSDFSAAKASLFGNSEPLPVFQIFPEAVVELPNAPR